MKKLIPLLLALASCKHAPAAARNSAQGGAGAGLSVVDPLKVLCPVLLIRGDHDGIATIADLFDFYRQLPNGDLQFVIVPQTAHNPTVGKNRFLYWHSINAFLTMPPQVA